jgi:PleD family two-component response regulator
MYGLTHRIAANDTLPQGDVVEPSLLARITPLGARATVLVIDRDPLTLAMVRRAVGDHYHVVVARDAEEALGLVNDMRPDALIFDVGLDDAEVAMVTVALAACDVLDATPAVMVDPDEPMNTITLRCRIDDAIRVSRRVYLGGGLRHRVAA